MKLAKIAHYRCDSYESTSYVSIPEDMTVEQLDEFVDLATEKALDAERAAKATAPPYPDQRNLMQTLPKETTLAQIEVELEKRKKEYAEWEAKKNTARRSFLSWLEEVSNNTIVPISDCDCGDFEVSCHWGHNHGLSPDYSDDGL
jgi:hypothetical protein